MTHRFHVPPRRTTVVVSLLVWLLLLAACGGQPPPAVNPDHAVSVTRSDGSATLARPSTGSQGDLPDNAQLVAGDHLYTAGNQSVTLQFPDGSTLQLGPDSHLLFYAQRQSDRAPIFRLLAGSVTAELRSNTVEVQAYEETAMSFSMVVTDLAAVSRGVAGRYQLGFDGEILRATVLAGEFDLRAGNQQATLPAGWQAVVEPGRPLHLVSLITPTPAPPSATEAPTATPIPIISLTPTKTPTVTHTPTNTATPTRTPGRILRTATRTAGPTIIVDTPTSTAAPPQPPPPNPTKPPPTNPPPTNSPPTNSPPTNPPPTPTDTPRPPPTAEPPTSTPGL